MIKLDEASVTEGIYHHTEHPRPGPNDSVQVLNPEGSQSQPGCQ